MGIASILFAVLALISGRSSSAARPPAPYVPNRVLVAFKGDVALSARLSTVKRLGLEPEKGRQSKYFARLAIPSDRVKAGASVESAIAALKKDPTVRVAEPDYICTIDRTPNDPRFSELFGMNNTGQGGGVPDADIDAVEAWDTTIGSDTMVVGVIDTGVDYNHPDLKDNILRDANNVVIGLDAANNDNDPMDDNDHGTHCAGTIGARGDNNVGVAGVNWHVRIMPLKFLDSNGSGATSDAIDCIDFATSRKVRITSNSWGNNGSRSQVLADAITRFGAAGGLFIAAAGNGGSDGVSDDNDSSPHWPSNFSTELDNVVAVAATDNRDILGSFSNFGLKTVNLGAPGVQILSTVRNNGYELFDGTSMATPHVAGACALVLSQATSMTYLELKNQILSSVDPISNLNGRCTTGGRLNVARALRKFKLTSPNGGETVLAGDPLLITWQSAGFPADHTVKIEVSRDDGANYTSITNSTEDDGLFEWIAEGPTSTQCRIRITSNKFNNISDSSDDPFSIILGSIQVKKPNGGEEAIIGTRSTITWEPKDFAAGIARVRIELSRNGGNTWETIASSTANDGTQDWAVSGPETEDALVRVSTINPSLFSDVSDAPFTIRLPSTLTVTAPNGPAVLAAGKPVDITWKSTGFKGNVKIELTRNAGSEWEELFPSVANDGKETWVVSGPATRSARLRVTSVQEPTVTDSSNGLLEIVVPSINVTSPTKGSKGLIGSQLDVKWSSVGVAGASNVRVDLSRDGGASWTPTIASTVNDGAATIDIAGPATNNALIRVVALDGSGAQGISTGFTIAVPTIFVVSPSGGTRLKIGTQTLFEWTGTSLGNGTVDIFLSKDGGRTFPATPIIANTENDGAETWGVRGPATKNAVLMIAWRPVRTVQGKSEGHFQIVKKKTRGHG